MYGHAAAGEAAKYAKVLPKNPIRRQRSQIESMARSFGSPAEGGVSAVAAHTSRSLSRAAKVETAATSERMINMKPTTAVRAGYHGSSDPGVTYGTASRSPSNSRQIVQSAQKRPRDVIRVPYRRRPTSRDRVPPVTRAPPQTATAG